MRGTSWTSGFAEVTITSVEEPVSFGADRSEALAFLSGLGITPRAAAGP